MALRVACSEELAQVCAAAIASTHVARSPLPHWEEVCGTKVRGNLSRAVIRGGVLVGC